MSGSQYQRSTKPVSNRFNNSKIQPRNLYWIDPTRDVHYRNFPGAFSKVLRFVVLPPLAMISPLHHPLWSFVSTRLLSVWETRSLFRWKCDSVAIVVMALSLIYWIDIHFGKGFCGIWGSPCVRFGLSIFQSKGLGILRLWHFVFSLCKPRSNWEARATDWFLFCFSWWLGM